MSINQCQALKNSSHHDNISRIRIAMLNDCKFISIEILLSVIESLRMPYTLTFHKTFGTVSDSGSTGLIGDVVTNRSDIGAAHYGTTYERLAVIDFSPMLGYGSPISILSGKILANTGNQFNVFKSFSTDLWISFSLTLIVESIFEIFVHFKIEHSCLTFIIEIFSNLFNLIIRFVNQNSNKYSRICCSKHLILNSMTLISIFLMMLFFNSEILSNIVYNPLLHIDSLYDLAQFISTHPDILLISDNASMTWTLMKSWQDDQVQMLFQKMQGVPISKFDYKQVYNGKIIIISFDDVFGQTIKNYPYLKFHISNDRHFGTQYGLIYSKHLNRDIKLSIDSKIRSVVETGLYNFWTAKRLSKKLNISDFDESHQPISLDYFKNILILFLFIQISLLIIFIVESYLLTIINFHALINKFLLSFKIN